MENQVNPLTLRDALNQVSIVTTTRGQGHLMSKVFQSIGLDDSETRDLILRDVDDFLFNAPELNDFPLNLVLTAYGAHMLLTGIIWGSNNPNAVTIEKEETSG